ncbi:hypothetical protein F5Y18DRAFT_383675 [Xylariaceae sp. FL1019]|nr:hypothetical protein F5Y18DRAFT_383675 [Xylariaceae sp. FL1019]
MALKRKTTDTSSFDEDLLGSALFADVTVECGDKEWHLHRNILVSRCVYFSKGLTGPFKEASEQKITIHDQDPQHVYWLIYYIYTTRAAPDLVALLQNDATCLSACVALLNVADFFLLDALCTIAVNLAQEYLLKHLKGFQTCLRDPDPAADLDKLMSAEFQTSFFEAVALTYESPSKQLQRIRRKLVRFSYQTNNYAMHIPSFRDRAFENPDFAVDVFKMYLQKQPTDIGNMIMPDYCSLCAEASDLYTKVSGRKESGKGVTGYCRSCNPVGDPDVYKFLGEPSKDSAQANKRIRTTKNTTRK